MLADPRMYGVSAQPSAAIHCALRPPPSSRAMNATRITVAAPAARLTMRRATSEPGASLSTSQPTTAIRGGKST